MNLSLLLINLYYNYGHEIKSLKLYPLSILSDYTCRGWTNHAVFGRRVGCIQDEMYKKLSQNRNSQAN